MVHPIPDLTPELLARLGQITDAVRLRAVLYAAPAVPASVRGRRTRQCPGGPAGPAEGRTPAPFPPTLIPPSLPGPAVRPDEVPSRAIEWKWAPPAPGQTVRSRGGQGGKRTPRCAVSTLRAGPPK